MTKIRAMKLADEVFLEAAKMRLGKALAEESALVAEDSMEVLHAFEMIVDDEVEIPLPSGRKRDL